MLNIFGMVVATFSVTDKVNWVRFFEKIFLIANVSPEIVFAMLYLILRDVNFLGQEFCWKIYTTEKTLPTIRYVKSIGKNEFAAIALDLEHKTYVIYVRSVSSIALPSSPSLDIHPSHRSQIAGLIAKEPCTKILNKYIDFADVFFPDLVSKLSEYTGINNHAIKLIDG